MDHPDIEADNLRQQIYRLTVENERLQARLDALEGYAYVQDLLHELRLDSKTTLVGLGPDKAIRPLPTSTIIADPKSRND